MPLQTVQKTGLVRFSDIHFTPFSPNKKPGPQILGQPQTEKIILRGLLEHFYISVKKKVLYRQGAMFSVAFTEIKIVLALIQDIFLSYGL